jgi:branched-chain amino acid aminotransferase
VTWVYLDGDYLPLAEAKVAADDAGLLYGRGLFETFRARRGAVYLLERHFDRLEEGAQTLGIVLPQTLADLRAAVRTLTERCGLEDARVRLTLTAGSASGRPSLLIQARAATDYPQRLYERGMSALVARVRRNETSTLTRVKSLNYLENLLAREQARRAGRDEALFLNTCGRLADGSATNVFLVRDGELFTPPVEDGALPGITRGAVLQLARAACIGTREVSLTLDDLRDAEEAFLTNAVAGLLPLVSVDGAKVGSGRPGPLTRRLRELYKAAASKAANRRIPP